MGTWLLHAHICMIHVDCRGLDQCRASLPHTLNPKNLIQPKGSHHGFDETTWKNTYWTYISLYIYIYLHTVISWYVYTHVYCSGNSCVICVPVSQTYVFWWVFQLLFRVLQTDHPEVLGETCLAFLDGYRSYRIVVGTLWDDFCVSSSVIPKTHPNWAIRPNVFC